MSPCEVRIAHNWHMLEREQISMTSSKGISLTYLSMWDLHVAWILLKES